MASPPTTSPWQQGKNAPTRTLLVDVRQAAEILASLDQPPSESQEDIDQLWVTEIERRAKRVLACESYGERWDEVRSRIERDLTAG